MNDWNLKIYTWLKGEKVGEDIYGNRYYRAKTEKIKGQERRWVLYKGLTEASKVPSLWHAWLHKTTNTPPSGEEASFPWEQPHQPNLTGTTFAYHPAGHPLAEGKRPKATGDYEPWQP